MAKLAPQSGKPKDPVTLSEELYISNSSRLALQNPKGPPDAGITPNIQTHSLL